MQSEM